MLYARQLDHHTTRRSHALPPPFTPHTYTQSRADGEAVALALPVSFHIGDDLTGATGSLHITTRRLVWIASASDGAEGYSVPFQSLTMHAISRDTSEGGFPRECIYMQVEGSAPDGYGGGNGGAAAAAGVGGPGGGDEGEDSEDSEEDFGGDFDEMTELRIVPEDPTQLDAMFKTLCECAAMNPDDDDDEEDDDDDDEGGMGVGVGAGGGGAGEFYYNEEEVLSGAGAAARAAMLDHYDSLLQMPTAGELDELIQNDPGRFEED